MYSLNNDNKNKLYPSINFKRYRDYKCRKNWRSFSPLTTAGSRAQNAKQKKSFRRDNNITREKVLRLIPCFFRGTTFVDCPSTMTAWNYLCIVAFYVTTYFARVRLEWLRETIHLRAREPAFFSGWTGTRTWTLEKPSSSFELTDRRTNWNKNDAGGKKRKEAQKEGKKKEKKKSDARRSLIGDGTLDLHR